MELFLILQCKKVDHSNFKLVLVKLSKVGMKEFVNLKKVEKLHLHVHQTMHTVLEALEMLFLLTQHCNFKLNYLIFWPQLELAIFC